ncbi:TATDN3 isoform 16, partial [Pan troglodytes]
CLGVHPVQGLSPEDQRSVTLKVTVIQNRNH